MNDSVDGVLSADPPPSGPTIGTDPAWDGDDATYYTTGGGEGGPGGSEWAGFFPLPAVTIPAGWTSFGIYLRYMQLPGSDAMAVGGRKSVGGIDATEGSIANVGSDPRWGVWSGSSGNYNIVTIYAYNGINTDLAAQQAFADLIATGNAAIGAHINGAPHRVLDVWVEFGGVEVSTRRRMPHLRGFQRGSDGQGITGGKRGIGNRSRQASIRRGPGSFY